MKKILLGLLAVLTLTFVACEKDDETSKVNEDGLTQAIVNLVPDSILNEIKSLGMPIYGGENPPKLDDYYLVEPFILVSSNISSDWEGMQFADLYIRFYNRRG